MLAAKINALIIAKYKLSVVCQDKEVQNSHPELADQVLSVISDIEKQIISLKAKPENIISHENSYQSTRN